MEGPVLSALIDIAALTGRAAVSVPEIPPLKAGPLLDDVCAGLSQRMEDQRREMVIELASTAAELEAMIFEGKIGFADEIGES
ncbi:hypothetical protein OK015_28615 (plasmid) [Mycobacterium sp. Aquia_216]|uniref:hypothetical protein n=1 Tax=Mycobacterium sp. Aquia_216 TaxID=2991729 RepID=UPI00227CB9E9|nr:hypothetical protein [Mycobacterium sp. Aquia_216]WAJ48013.1 hypothetical protein OK015_28615 [Mycobacterium sp. Aquia_216]